MVIDSYTLGFLMTKNPWLVFRKKRITSKQKVFVFSFMEKMLVIQFHRTEKCLSYNLILWNKSLNAYHAILMKKLKFYFQSMEKLLFIKFYSMGKKLTLLFSYT